ncbi:hypothetical protein J1N35_013715 [Gossypium stocksii]|uniref:Uncharacterized protein n=1 Tax=Gossypium stocksii TaxID=47602 RepID=A0A9D3VVD1_9ROSI|nr:hypothetical protein J1N35_013715 [Gossypium stocksii]
MLMTSTLPKNGLWGMKLVLQLMKKPAVMLQSPPVPNGYGMITSPQRLRQPGFATTGVEAFTVNITLSKIISCISTSDLMEPMAVFSRLGDTNASIYKFGNI